MNYTDLMDTLFTEFPNLRGQIDEEDIASGSYIVFMNYINPWVIELLNNERDNQQPLSEVFDFMERIATEGDKDSRNLLMTSILERLGDKPSILKKAERYMGPKTKCLSKAIEKFWGRR